MKKDLFRILVPTGMLGYGFPIEAFQKGISMNPDFISIDSGSTDSGPQKLALGETTCNRISYVEEMEIILKESLPRKIPVFISSAGGDGTNLHVDLFVEIVKELAAKNNWKLKVATIYSDIDKELIIRKIGEGKVSPCGPLDDLVPEEVDLATVVVAQMGAEPFVKVLEECPDIDLVIAGRSYDPAPMAAAALYHGFDPGLAWHMGKIMECGSQCAEPASRCIVGELHQDYFELIPLLDGQRCTPQSVAAHTLYEKTHPFLLKGPGGTLNLEHSQFVQGSEISTKVSGSQFTADEHYTVKLEGAKPCGYRTIAIAGIRDPLLIAQIDPFLDGVRETIAKMDPELIKDSQLIFHVYGKDGVMGESEPHPEQLGKELCVIIEVAAPTQDAATVICNRARVSMLHDSYEGRKATGANIGSPFTPLEIKLGQVCEFNVYHIMEIDDPVSLFPINYMEV